MKTQETECSAALKTNDTTWQVLIITIEFVIGLPNIKELIRYDSAPACKKSQPRAIASWGNMVQEDIGLEDNVPGDICRISLGPKGYFLPRKKYCQNQTN